MYPTTLYGWYNKLIRGHPYNEQTALILDHNFRPSPRLLAMLARENHHHAAGAPRQPMAESRGGEAAGRPSWPPAKVRWHRYDRSSA